MQRIKTWQLIVLLVILTFVSATLLRLNNIGMVQRRAAVMSADSKGDDTITQKRLYDLQQYVSAHMNTDLGKGVYLESSYNRDYNKLLSEASKDGIEYGNIYKAAQDVCAPQFSVYSSAYLQCTLNELEKYPASNNLVSTINLSPETYLHDFASPLWSPDFAGWSVLICLALAIMIITRFISVLILRILLKYRYKTI